MRLYRRHLPHWIPDDTILFVTWRLAGSKPHDASGPKWLVDPRIARMLVEALYYGETVRQLYCLHAWVIMPNHVHVIWEPTGELPPIMRWLKGRTSRTANQILGRTGMPFWQDESYDHWIRSSKELRAMVGYAEENPVRAGLAGAAAEWRWSSAWPETDDKNRSSVPQAP